MTIRLNPRWLLISALLFSLQFCRAQTEIPPTLSFNLGTDDPNDCKLWDLHGDYNVQFEITARNGIVIPVQLSFSLNQDNSGKLSSPAGNISGLVFNNDDNSGFIVATKVAGKVSGSGGFARARFTVHFSGNGSFGGVPNLNVSGSMTVVAETDSSGQLSGRIRNFQANISGVNNISGKSDFAVGLPSDGTWNLTLNVAGLQKLTGNGSVGLPSETLGLDLSGGVRGGLIRLNAKGASDVPNTQSGKGVSAKIILTPTFDTLQLKGRMLGQKISLNVGTATPE